MEFDVNLAGKGRRRDESEPMRLLVLGDFSGRPIGERGPLADRAIQRIDIDSVDAVMRRLEPRAVLPDDEIRFQQIDDFHPDRLYARLDRFQRLRQSRAAPPAAPDDDQIARLLGKPPVRNAAAPASGLDALIRDAVAPHVVKDTSAVNAVHLQAVDAAIAEDMRALLHAPAFQAIEAAWRGVHWLTSSLELDENLQLHLLDVTREELLADIVAAGGKLENTGLHRAVVDRSRSGVEGRRWSALVGLMRFGPATADIALLAALGLTASRAGGPCLADADLGLTDDRAGEPAGWPALRRSEAATWIALAAPRILLRMPYGRHSDPVEGFAFEELAASPEAETFLWGHASLAMALLVGRAFMARGWEMDPGDEPEIGDLPAYTFERDGERQLQPCAERLLSDRDIDTLVKSGLVPIAGRRDRNSVVVVRFQSVSDPPAPLAW
jgi:type VI secretion system ImpC/EvpB family protein